MALRSQDEIVAALKTQAGHCRELGSGLYADLMMRAAETATARHPDPVAAILADHDGDLRRDQAVLRLFGGVHRLVLERRAGALAAHYPSVGGTYAGDVGPCWEAFGSVAEEHAQDLLDGMHQAPQTNEVGRGAALVGGLCKLVGGLPVRLFEIGASAGLNLRADAFRIEHVSSDDATGPPESPVRLAAAWQGVVPTQAVPRVVDRAGVDVAPVDPLTTDGRLLLTSYVWADQIVRLERLRAAFVLAERIPVRVTRGGAADAVEMLTLRAGVVTVIWHSVVWQYLDDEEQRRVAAAVDALAVTASSDARLAWLSLEPDRSQSERLRFAVRLRQWPGRTDEVLGHAPAHGVPVTWD